MRQLARATLLVQGAFYVVTGLWPVVNMAAFELVTGPKTDDWLVRMVGLLAAAIGATLFTAVRRGRVTPEVRLLAIASALSFAAIDLTYALGGRISAVYLLDAAAEFLFAGILATAGRAAED